MQSSRIARRSQIRQLGHRSKGKPSRTFLLVADNHRAMLFRNGEPGRTPELTMELKHEEGRLSGHELANDRPGRTVDSWTASGAGPHGSNARHGYGGESQDPKEHESMRWAETVARWLDRGATGRGLQELVLVAEPRFLGRLRQSLPEPLMKRVGATHAHDFAKLEGAELVERLAKLAE